MQATDALLEQWEPKVRSMLRGVITNDIGIGYEDAAQELRIAIIKAAEKWNETKGASFHTYLHVVMQNTVRNLIHYDKKKRVATEDIEEVGFLVPHHDEPELWFDIFRQAKLNTGEVIVLDILLCGYNRSEVVRMSETPKTTIKIIKSLKKKCAFLQKEGAVKSSI